MARSLNVILGAASASGAGASRDRRRLTTLFLMPLAVMGIIGFAMGGYSSESFVVGMLDRAHTTESRALAQGLVVNQQFRIREYTDQDRLRMAVFRGRMNAGILIPPAWHGDRSLSVYFSSASSI